MPVLARDVNRLLIRLDGEDLRMFRNHRRRRRMKMQLAKATAERLVLLHAELLVAKKEHQMVHQGTMQLLELPVAERLRLVNAEDLSADLWGRFLYGDRRIS